MDTCKIDGCENPTRSKGLCQMHYMRERRHGDPTKVGKAGRPVTHDHKVIKEVYPEISASTRSKYVMAVRRLEATFGDRYDEVLKLIGNRRSNAYRTNYSATAEEANTLLAIHLATTGRWQYGERISAEDYLKAIEAKSPRLMRIYREFAPT